MPRVFVAPEELNLPRVKLLPEETHYLLGVRRLRAGDRLIVSDGAGRARSGVLLSLRGGEAEVELGEYLALPPEPPVKVHLLQGVAKGEKMDLLVQKATELGVERITPLLTEYVVGRWNQQQACKKRDRWQKIAREAVRQCGRAWVPRVEEILPWSQALERLLPTEVKLMPWEGELKRSLRACLAAGRETQVAIFIGPEGGFSPGEVKEACARGVITVTLGPRILRTETAGLVALALVLYSWGDLGGGIDAGAC
ncbi:16S rRNA (uracil(1498)-N(3))-methyltransferase [Desulfothermobacter acidiphilus]|uniref:16S rRNA (uracil(1498)-N(3))-methyltransferase n=1 Tax=Desulfothermobacter acidiphilus TaxID=1938353 RepID=UPI003F891502